MEDRIAEGILIFIVAVLIYLKIAGIITISWLWFLSPIWIPLLIGCAMAIYLLILFWIECLFGGKK